MNEKELNLQVLAKLVEIANVIFAKLSINIEGTFTAAELWEGKNSLRENIVIDYHGTEFDTYDIEVGTFKCSFTPEKVFYLIWKFEQLCRVRQENKARFTYGVEKREIVTGKAMYIGKGEKVMKRKKTLVRLSEHVAYEPCKQSDSVDMYYFAGGIWYYVQRAYNESQLDRMANKLENDTEWLKNTLNGMDYTQDIAINTIYKALRDVLRNELIKERRRKRKSENEPENAVSGESLRNRPNFTKPFRNHIVMVRRLENGAYHCKQFLLNEVGNGLYRDADNLFFEFGEYCYTLGGYTHGVASFLKEQQDIKAKIVSMIEAGGIRTESANILYEKLTGHKLGGNEPEKKEIKEIGRGLHTDTEYLYFEHSDKLHKFCSYTYKVGKFFMEQEDIRGKIIDMVESGFLINDGAKLLYEELTGYGLGKPAKVNEAKEETHEDYPPEPYNKTGESSCNEAGSMTDRKDVRTTFSRQKAFPNKLYSARRKIRRFKPFSCFIYTNYHPIGESVANQTGSGKSGGYSVVAIRGSTG